MGNQGWPIIGYRTANESGKQMEPKKTMTLNLSVEEMTALEELASEKELSKTGVIRQALRLYQLIHERTAAGEKLVFEDEKEGKKAEVMLL
jgi:predicted transcriptional regulator